MALAMVYPDTESGAGRGNKSKAKKAAETAGFSSRRLNEARSVLRYSRELAESVLMGVTPLNEALAAVQQQQQYQQSDEAKLTNHSRRDVLSIPALARDDCCSGAVRPETCQWASRRKLGAVALAVARIRWLCCSPDIRSGLRRHTEPSAADCFFAGKCMRGILAARTPNRPSVEC